MTVSDRIPATYMPPPMISSCEGPPVCRLRVLKAQVSRAQATLKTMGALKVPGSREKYGAMLYFHEGVPPWGYLNSWIVYFIESPVRMDDLELRFGKPPYISLLWECQTR